MKDSEINKLISRALRMVSISLPYLSGLAAEIKLIPDERIPFAGICASGRLLYNPEKLNNLNLEEITFVLAHEIMHLMLRSHDRSAKEDQLLFNVSHDYIINDILEKELGIRPPAGGLRMPNASLMSGEQLAQKIRDNRHLIMSSWGKGIFHLKSDMAEKLSKAMNMEETHIETYNSDVISEGKEAELFPDLNPEKVRQLKRNIIQLSSQSNSVKILKEKLDHHKEILGQTNDIEFTFENALAGIYTPPWEMMLQKWIDATEPGPRSYYRPSRRDAGHSDVIMPGRTREGWTLHIVLDTSGSMTDEFPFILGAITSFCMSSGVSQVHLIQSDMEVTYNEYVEVEQLYNFRILGLGGSDMTMAMKLLSDDPEVQAAIVITDGFIIYPINPVPYKVLWVLPFDNSDFKPDYGLVIKAERK